MRCEGRATRHPPSPNAVTRIFMRCSRERSFVRLDDTHFVTAAAAAAVRTRQCLKATTTTLPAKFCPSPNFQLAFQSRGALKFGARSQPFIYAFSASLPRDESVLSYSSSSSSSPGDARSNKRGLCPRRGRKKAEEVR